MLIKTINLIVISISMTSAILSSVASENVAAAENNSHDISIHKAWIREAPPNSKVLAAYMEIENTSTEIVDLVAAESNEFERIEFHQSEMTNGVARMRSQDNISIIANSTFSFTPGGYHLMLFNPTSPMREGKDVVITFTFKDGEIKTLNVPVKRADSTDLHQHQHHDNHDHH